MSTAACAQPATGDALAVIDHLSPSGIKDYLGCSLRFFFSRILRLPAPVTPSLHIGRAVHAGIEEANRMLFRGEPVRVEDALDAFLDAYDRGESEAAIEWRDSDAWSAGRETGERVLRAFLEGDVFKASGRPLGVEVKLAKVIPGTPLALLGFVDRVNPDNSLVDYKTVASTPDLEAEVWLHQVQLAAYSELVEDATGKPCTGAELVFLVKTKTPKVIVTRLVPPTKEQRKRFWSLVSAVIEGIRDWRFHPAPGNQCSWCAYRKECAGWTGAGMEGEGL